MSNYWSIVCADCGVGMTFGGSWPKAMVEDVVSRLPAIALLEPLRSLVKVEVSAEQGARGDLLAFAASHGGHRVQVRPRASGNRDQFSTDLES